MMNSPLGTLALLFTLITSPVHAAEVGQDNLQNVRPRDAYAELLIRVGQERSTTFRRLLSDLARSHVVVYVDVRHESRYPMAGSLRFVGESGGIRWVLATVDTGTSEVGRTQRLVFELTGLLGHELQHAREVSHAEIMTNQVEFERYFRAAGVGRWDTLDTVAARQVGAAVDNELRGLTNQLLDLPVWARLDVRNANENGPAPAGLRELMHLRFTGVADND